MNVSEERDYYQSLVHEMADNMDKNIIEAYKWRACSKELFKVLSEYHEHRGLPTDTILYRNTLDALVKYENLLLDTEQK